MVGVPRSGGCRTCLQRRVKCDETRPACKRCEKRGQKCPGYEKRIKFCPIILSEDGFQVIADPGPFAAQPYKWIHHGLALGHCSSIDESVAPNLARMAIDVQQKEMFSLFVDANFPGLYYAWSSRVDVTFMDFVRQQSDAPTDALVWGTRTLGTLNLGQKNKDNDKIFCSRSMYTYGLRSLAHLIQNPATVKSDRTLGAAVLCGIYEILDGGGHRSWLTHSSGIATLFRLRGADAHRDGFGRTLLIAFRSFLVAEAFICGKPCFLADPEWRSVNQYAIRQERLAGKGSELGDVVEYAFDTITVCPGLVAQARAISTGNTNPDFSQRQQLALEITRSQQRLTELHDRLEVLSSKLISDKGFEERPDITGPIPVRVANMLAKFCLQGMKRATALLDRWLSFVELGQSSLVQVGVKEEVNVSHSSPPICPDHIALSMGMLAIE
ncbi:hypothetical protein N7510_010369 [Penicillium lagena]|uniref:uncharacterized protein n=1 Tax=Penicillium lagena TaxID=94218 RepID=UPI00253FDC94|nr:uncharacterized protein N7510_010369 [Penicillium lagena]KAJ5605215.1 hypothetical protein N7510_010369 [Penicillium lagena]